MDNKDKDARGSHTESDWNKNRDTDRRLRFLDELDDYKIVDDDPDVRGWTVVDDQDRPVGKVDNLLVDVTKERVRYLDVDLNREILGRDHEPLDSNDPSGVHEYEKDGDIHMIVPIGLARLDTDRKRVISDQVSNKIYQQGHTHRRGQHITPEYERRVVSSIRPESDKSKSHAQRGTATPSSNAGTTPTSTDRNIDRADTRTYDLSGSGSASDQEDRRREDRHEEKEWGNRETRRPTSSDDSDLRREGDFDRRSTKPSDRMSKDDDPNREREAEKRHQSGDEPGRDRENDNWDRDEFYDNDYFDDRRFYGRR